MTIKLVRPALSVVRDVLGGELDPGLRCHPLELLIDGAGLGGLGGEGVKKGAREEVRVKGEEEMNPLDVLSEAM